ncbi:SDR family oxidoreductase [Salinisphaera sp. Q1T1-3]|uniref:SDR family oxidoreductase n=1 Tax=Salinisphaera sp. Q1T1-3 TaxID=2321229 RepID=UPI000E759BE5|nr:SDR family oxidoreductase [Salinisphaera sp. Q1T1-3]RJS92354.1 SDR family oxidoreductase [Salinisphaera sp. Q1T1-3]
MSNIVIIGATSAIAERAARRFAERGDALYLVARRADKLAPIAEDLKVRGASQAGTHTMDADDLDAHGAMLDAAVDALGVIDQVLVAYGTLPDQQACEADPASAVAAWHTNAVSPIALVTAIANRLEAQGHGLIAVIGSVAGDRGRASNYVYGSAKAGLAAFLDGLRHRLADTDIDILTIKPGLVDTPMTAEIDKGPLFADAERVGRDIVTAMDKRRAEIYTPGFWRLIMAIIRMVPRPVFHRTKL